MAPKFTLAELKEAMEIIERMANVKLSIRFKDTPEFTKEMLDQVDLTYGL